MLVWSSAQELIAYILFFVIVVSDSANRKYQYSCLMKSMKQFISGAAMLVLLMGVTYEVHRGDGFKCQSFRKNSLDVQVILRSLPRRYERL
jgi:hypothetical protein